MMTCGVPACGKPVFFGNRAGESRLSCVGGHDLVLMSPDLDEFGVALNSAVARSLMPEAPSS